MLSPGKLTPVSLLVLASLPGGALVGFFLWPRNR